MIAIVDGVTVPIDVLWWPAMNYNQFRWDGLIGEYELVIPRSEFIERLAATYAQMVMELRADDLIDPKHTSPLKDADYPPLEVLPDRPAAFLEAMQVYLWDDLYTAFLPHQRATGPSFIMNSVESCSATVAEISIRGRGYHAPGTRLAPPGV